MQVHYKNNKPTKFSLVKTWEDDIPLYTQEVVEEARKLGMQQERALWELSASTQEIEATMSEKEYKVGNLEDIPDRHLTCEDAPFQVLAPKKLADEIDKALGIKR